MKQLINPKDIETIKKALEPIVDKLGDLGKQGFELALRQNYVYAIYDIVVVLFAIALIYLSIRVFKWSSAKVEGEDYRRWDWGSDEDGLSKAGAGLAILATIIAFALIHEYSFDAISRFVNPVWMTIQDLIKLAKG